MLGQNFYLLRVHAFLSVSICFKRRQRDLELPDLCRNVLGLRISWQSALWLETWSYLIEY